MSKRHALGRHRATPVRSNPLEGVSKAVASNAGSVGRQAAVIAAASGLVLTMGVPAQANPVAREAASAPVEALPVERTAVAAVTVSAKAVEDYEVERVVLEATPAPEPEPVVVAVAEQVETQTEEVEDEAQYAAMTRENVNNGGAAAQAAPAAEAAPEPEPVVDSAATGSGAAIAAMAKQYVGSPYVFGGNSPAGWDCSGFVQWIYAQHGINVARGTSAILGSGQFVRTSSPQLGDLVFQNGGGHVGIYIGNGQIVGAQNPSVGTVLRPANSAYGPLYGYYTLAR
ncbi:cell wall lytic activity [Kocuria polaris]|nr:cell wall lytic activity [Kocuria polaris]